MGPTSTVFLVLVGLLAIAATVVVVVYRRLWVRIPVAVVALVLPFLLGLLTVNAYYSYYPTWHQLARAIDGSKAPSVAGDKAIQQAAGQASDVPPGTLPTGDPMSGMPGKVESATFSGAASGISRDGLIYLPPEYGAPGYPINSIPVVELIHGTPGKPQNWVNSLSLQQTVDSLRAAHKIGPMIFVMPDANGGSTNAQECVDAPNGAKDDTYISQDVPSDVRTLLHLATTGGAALGIEGFSSGGYCAVNLGVRHAPQYAAVASLDGEFTPEQNGYETQLFGSDTAAAAANDPLSMVTKLTSSAPAFFLSAGSGSKADLKDAQAFQKAIPSSHVVQFADEPGAKHNFDAWREVLPSSLEFMWQQLTTSSLRSAVGATGS